MLDCLQNRPVALAHHWLVRIRGGEKVLESLARLTGPAPLYTLVCDRRCLTPTLSACSIHSSWLSRLPRARRLYPLMLPLMPRAAESMDLQRYRVVLISDSAVIKAVRTSPSALTLCYCHSPMRYLWDQRQEYRASLPRWQRPLFDAFVPQVRRRDRKAGKALTLFVSNSHAVARRVRRAYNRRSFVVYPQVATDAFEPSTDSGEGYLVLGYLSPYKRAEVAVAACTTLGRKLLVIGEGPQMARLRRIAGPTVTLAGYQPDAVIRRELPRCRALLFPGEEDFGIVPVEAMAAGRPVIAYRAGGAADTVIDGGTGRFFDEPTPESLADAIRRFEASEESLWPAEWIVSHARRFSTACFERQMGRLIAWAVDLHARGGPEAVRAAVDQMDPDHFLDTPQRPASDTAPATPRRLGG